MTALGLIVLGLVAGSLAATLGLGGGIIYVPALVTVFGFSQHVAQGTSLAIIAPTALIGAITHARAGRVDWRVAAWVAAGALVGALAGSQVALGLDETVLRRLFAVILVVVAFRMLARTRSSSASDGNPEDS